MIPTKSAVFHKANLMLNDISVLILYVYEEQLYHLKKS